MNQPTILPGFADPVHDAQRTFRDVLEAMSRPGRRVTLTTLPPAPEPFTPAMAAVALTLCDHDTPVWLDPVADERLRQHLRFHCGCPLAASPDQAAFAFVCDPTAMPPLAAFCQGEAEYPERSTTIVVAASLAPSSPGWNITGPGIEGQGEVRCGGLPGEFWNQWKENHAAYPLGVDVLFVDRDAVCGMPRTVALEDTPCM